MELKIIPDQAKGILLAHSFYPKIVQNHQAALVRIGHLVQVQKLEGQLLAIKQRQNNKNKLLQAITLSSNIKTETASDWVYIVEIN